MMKNLTAMVALLVCGFTPTVFAQCVEQTEPRGVRPVEIISGTKREYQNVSTPSTSAPPVEHKDRFTIFSAWLEMVKSAEKDYKSKNGRYVGLVALRKAHLLRGLVFESDSASGSKRTAEANLVPKSTLFHVKVWADGQHFRAEIGDDCMRVNADDTGSAVSQRVSPIVIRDIQDSPEGLIFTQ